MSDNERDFAQVIAGVLAQQPFMQYIGTELGAMREGYAELRVPHKPELTQHHGYFHAGVVGTLADNTAGAAAATLVPAGADVLTVEFKLNLMSPAQGEWLVAKSQVIKAGRTLTVCQSDVYGVTGDDESLCATALVTLFVIQPQGK